MKTAQIDVLAELARYGIKYDSSSEKSVKCACPFHHDKSPSCEVFINDATFKCFAASCGKKGHIVAFLAQSVQKDPNLVVKDLSERYDLERDAKTIDISIIERYHSRISEAHALRKRLYDRAITDDDIRKFRLGFDGQRITIPIFNGRGEVVNIRKYLPGAPSKDKMKNTHGYSEVRLYPYDQLQYEKIVIVGGEIKAIAGCRALNPQGIGCITVTGTEGAWRPQFSTLFAGKIVFLCFDIDEGGRTATQKIGAALVSTADSIRDVVLPLDPAEFPTGDPNDYIAHHGDNAFVGLVMNAARWVPPIKYGVKFDKSETPVELELSQAYEAEYTGKRVQFKAMIAAMHTSPFPVPKTVTITCPRDQPFCSFCPVKHSKPDSEFEIDDEHPSLLKMVGNNEKHQLEAIKSAVGIPTACQVYQPVPTKYYNVEEVRLSPELDFSVRATERTLQPAIVIGNQLELNDNYAFVGRMHPHPTNQQATMVVSGATPTQDALASFDDTDLADLNVFQPETWTVEGIQGKLDSIYKDLSANVTRIYKRDNMHLLVDLVYHSPLRINFDGRMVKGWAEALIIGDSSHGKTDVTNLLQQYYGLGAHVDCGNASAAGLHGGLQQVGGRWFVSWGIIPVNDKRLVILEELKRASVEVLARLTDMRSSGKAEIHKIEKRSTHARCRLIATSNPRTNLPMRSYNYGVEAVKELMGSLEDVRRFDAVIAVCAEDIPPAEFNKLTALREQTDHVYTSELCKKLILWAWSRNDNQVVFDDDATKAVLASAVKMSDKYSDQIPIVDRGSQRYKIARLAAALAARTFSHTNDNYSTILVRKCHVEYIENFLTTEYNKPGLGYAAFSESMNKKDEIKEELTVRLTISALHCSGDFIRLMANANFMDLTDLMDWGGLQPDVARDLLSTLVRHNALWRSGKLYIKSPAFAAMLKELDGMTDEERKQQLKPSEY